MPAKPPEAERMQCMEVWGGNSPVEKRLDTPGLEIWLRSQPYAESESGGDVYYVSSCASGRITRLLLADVSGHGQPAAAMAVRLRDLMRRSVNVISQKRFARDMNEQFAAHPGNEGFATAVVCTFFAPTKTLEFCNAGHPIPFIFRGSTGQWLLASDTADVQVAEGLADTPFGVIEGAEYSLYRTKLEVGDMMLCVSDAFSESRDADGQMLNVEGLYGLVKDLTNVEPVDIIPQVTAKLKSLCPDNLNEDDATILLFRASGTGVSLANNLLAPFRLFRPTKDNTELKF